MAVLKPFPAHSYFFGRNDALYFSVPTEKGDLRLRCFDGQSIRDVGVVNASLISIEDLAVGFVESPFFSFSHVHFRALYSRGADLVTDEKRGVEKLILAGRTMLELTKGQDFKGSFYCSDLPHSTFLPGGRYLLFSVPYCGNYKGQLLIDTVTGQYESLPKGSSALITLTTDTIKGYRVTSAGISAN